MITDLMLKRMDRALKMANGVYSLDDIIEQIKIGKLQGHVEGNTWAITQVQDFPRKKVVEIICVVGNLDDSLILEKKIERWSKEHDADFILATGREGWWNFKTLGWKRAGVVYTKELAK